MNKAFFIEKKVRGGLIPWVIVMSMLTGCASLQTKEQGETAVPSTGLSEKIQKHRTDRFSSCSMLTSTPVLCLPLLLFHDDVYLFSAFSAYLYSCSRWLWWWL